MHTVIPHVPVVIRLGVFSSILAKPSGQEFVYFVFAKRVRSSAFSPICNASVKHLSKMGSLASGKAPAKGWYKNSSIITSVSFTF